MRYVSRALLAGFLGFAVALLAACGSSGGLLSADQASTLNAQLNSVSAALAGHQCAEVARAVSTLTNSASSLGGVDGTLSSTVAQGADAVAALAQRECPARTASTSSSSTSTSTTSTTTTTTTPTTTTTTTPTTTSSTSATTTPTTTTPTTPAPPSTTGTTGGAGLGNGGTGTAPGATSTGGAAGLPGSGGNGQ